MRTEFTREEMYDAYMPEMVRYGVNELAMNAEEVAELLEKTGFKKRFTENIDDYYFCTPGEALEEEARRLRR